MKAKIIYGFLGVLIFITSCRKSDNPGLPDNLQRAAIPQVSKDSSGDVSISSQDIDGFTGKAIIDQYYKSDHGFKSLEAVIRKNGDNSTVKVLQTGINSLPTTVTFTAAQISALFGEPIAAGDSYDIGADVILQNGQRVEAFPTDGISNYDPNIGALPGIGAFSANYPVFCPFDAAAYEGDFVVVQDDWADYQPGDVVSVTMVDATHISFVYNGLDVQPIIVAVDPATNVTSVANQYFENYGPPFGNFFIQSVASANNYVIPCNGTLSIVNDIYSDNPVYGDQGNFRIVLQKQ